MTASPNQVRPTILISGYSSWALADPNPAAAVVQKLQGRNYDLFDLITVEIPVASKPFQRHMQDLIQEHSPDAWIGVGVAAGASILRTEAIGINCLHFSVPDNDGYQPDMTPIIADGPDAYFTNLPHQTITQDARRAGIPMQISFSAGTHLCNQMTYTLRHHCTTAQLPMLSGFIHVPQSPENVAAAAPAADSAASMSIETSTRGVEIAAICTAKALKATQGL